VPWRNVWEWRRSSTVLDLGTRWKWAVCLTLLPLYPWQSPEPLWALWRKEGFLSCLESNSGRPAWSPSIFQRSYPDAQSWHWSIHKRYNLLKADYRLCSLFPPTAARNAAVEPLTLTKTFHRHLYDIKHKQLPNVLFHLAVNITLFPTGGVTV
jgi:hypothetical protein